MEELGYDNLVISIKSSDVLMCVAAHELIAKKTNYPLHVGITESGTLLSGNIKSSVGLGIILHEGIGDTIRVSLTGDPVEESKERETDPENVRAQEGRRGSCFLSDLRKDPDRPHSPGKSGRGYGIRHGS